jgi:hypothetical protein
VPRYIQRVERFASYSSMRFARNLGRQIALFKLSGTFRRGVPFEMDEWCYERNLKLNPDGDRLVRIAAVEMTRSDEAASQRQRHVEQEMTPVYCAGKSRYWPWFSVVTVE